MFWTNLILTLIALMVAGRYLGDWRRTHRRRGQQRGPQARYTSLEAAVDHMTDVADGLHEDLDSVRQELRAALSLPKETQIPRVLHELQITRLIAWASLALNVAILIAWIIAEASR